MAALHGRAPKGACGAALRSFTGPLRLLTLSFCAFLLAYVFILRRVLFPRAVDPSLAPYRHLASVHSGAAGAPPAHPLPAAWYLAPAAADALHGGAAASASAAAPAPPSFWHSLPLRPAAQPQLVTFVCEIPHGGTAKYEVQTALPGTPIAQDGTAGGGAPRHYAWRALLNYGMLPQTLEDAQGPRALSGLPGDGDPLDALDLWPAPCAPGEAYAARVVGALGMLDGGATDWKVLVVRHHGGLPAALLEDVAELAPALESLAGDEAAAAAAGGAGGAPAPPPAPPPHPVLTLLAGGGGGAAPGSAAAVSAAPAPAAQHPGSWLQARVAAELPPAALAGALAGALAAMPRSEDGEWGGCAGGAGGRVTFAAPRGGGGGGGPGARHATHPPALLAALSRVASGGGVGEEEAAVLRGSVRVWAATRLAHVREWLAGYKAAAAAAAGGSGGGSAPSAEFLWGGALLDARSAQAVVEQAHADYGAAKREGRVGL